MKRFLVIALATAAGMAAQTMKERVKPYLAQALADGNAFVSVSAASGTPEVAPGSLASLYGPNLADQTAFALAPYPSDLGGLHVQVVDSAGNSQNVGLLYVSPEQINYVMPSGMADGPATVIVMSDAGDSLTGAAQNQKVAPALFTANMNGQGVVAATAYRTFIPSPRTAPVQVFQCGAAPGSCVSVPIDPGLDAPVTITIYATGIKGRSSDKAVTVTIGNTVVPVRSITSSDDKGPTAGIDQITFGLPISLRGTGEVNIFITVDGVQSNTARINIQ